MTNLQSAIHHILSGASIDDTVEELVNEDWKKKIAGVALAAACTFGSAGCSAKAPSGPRVLGATAQRVLLAKKKVANMRKMASYKPGAAARAVAKQMGN